MALQSHGPLIQIVGESVQLLVRVIHKSVAIAVSRQEQSACHRSNLAARSGGAAEEGRAAVPPQTGWFTGKPKGLSEPAAYRCGCHHICTDCLPLNPCV
jgi:hypothetical protein